MSKKQHRHFCQEKRTGILSGKLCSTCARRPPRINRKTCQVCADYVKAWSENNRARRKAQARRTFLKNKKKVYVQQEAWWKANPEKRELKRIRRLLARHGITIEEYHRLYDFQSGRCAICEQQWPALDLTPKNGKIWNRLSVDHDHTTGKIRGLLCASCNAGLGRFKDKQELLERAAVYLAAPMMKALMDSRQAA